MLADGTGASVVEGAVVLPETLFEEVSAATPVEDGTLVSAMEVVAAVEEVVSAALADAMVVEAATDEGVQHERVEVVLTQGSVPL